MLNFMLFITFVIFLAVVLSNIGLVLNLSHPLSQSPIYFRTPQNILEDKILEAENQLTDANDELKSITVAMHNFNKKLSEAEKEIKHTNKCIKEAVELGDNEEAKKYIRTLGRQETRRDKLKEAEDELQVRHEAVQVGIDDKENEIISLKHELVMEGQVTTTDKKSQNIEDQLIQAAEDAEVEEKLEDFKRKYDDHNPT